MLTIRGREDDMLHASLRILLQGYVKSFGSSKEATTIYITAHFISHFDKLIDEVVVCRAQQLQKLLLLYLF